MGSFLPTVWLPGNVDSAKANLLATAQGIDASVQACTSLDATTESAWTAFYSTLTTYAQTPTGWFTTGADGDQVQFYQRELYAWQQKLSKTCSIAVPSVDPSLPPPTEVADAIRWAGIALTALAAAYVVGEFVQFIPKLSASAK